MRLTKLVDIKSMADQTPIRAIAGTVTKIRDRFTGTTDNRQWSLQKMIIEDGGATAIVMLDGRDPADPSWIGRRLLFRLSDTGTGVYCRDDKKDGAVVGKLIKITPTGVIEVQDDWAGNESKGSYVPPPPTPTPPTLTTHTDDRAQPQVSDEELAKRRIQSIRFDLNRRANLYLLCMQAAEYVRMQWQHLGKEMSDGHFQAATASLFIGAERNGSASSMPTGKFTDLEL